MTVSAAEKARLKAIEGYLHRREAGIKVGLRFTVNRQRGRCAGHVRPDAERKDRTDVLTIWCIRAAPRSCEKRTRAHPRSPGGLLDLIADRTKAMFDDGLAPEILTVDNHADSVS